MTSNDKFIQANMTTREDVRKALQQSNDAIVKKADDNTAMPYPAGMAKVAEAARIMKSDETARLGSDDTAQAVAKIIRSNNSDEIGGNGSGQGEGQRQKK